MAEPAFKNRKDMSEDLKAAGFDDRQIRSILRVVAGMVQELGQAIRADLEKLERRMLELHEEAKEYSRKLYEQSEKLSQEREKRSEQRHEQSEKLNQKLHEEAEKRNRQAFLWIRWGFGVVVSLLCILIVVAIRGGL